jgi:hypothetical protein
MQQAGAGAGIFNTTRQVGAVLGSAAIAVLMQSRIAAELPATAGSSVSAEGGGTLPRILHAGFSTAMAQSLLLPAAVVLIGLIAVLCYAAPKHLRSAPTATEEPAPVPA